MPEERKMVEVALFEDGTYTVKDIDSHCATQYLIGSRNGQYVKLYYCPKDKWKYYLLKLCDTKGIDNQINELRLRKEKLENLKLKLKGERRNESHSNNNKCS